MNTIQKFADLLRKWNIILNKKQKRLSVCVCLLFFISSLLETLGVSVIIPFISVMLSPDKVVGNEYLQMIFNRLSIPCTDTNVLLLLGIAIILVYLLKNIFLLLSDYVSLWYENNIQRDFSILMLESYLKRPYIDSLDINSAEALRGISGDVTGLYYIIQSFFRIFASGLTILLIGAFLVKTDAVMAVGIIIVSGFVFLFITCFLKKRIQVSGVKFNNALSEVTKQASQALNGLKDITVLNRQNEFIHIYRGVAENQKQAQLRYRFLQVMPMRIIETAFVVLVIVFSCLRFMAMEDASTFIPKLSAFAIAAIRIMPLVNMVTTYSSTIIYYMPSFYNAYENIIESQKYLQAIAEENSINSEKEIKFDKSITLHNVYWKYRGSDIYVLENLNLIIKKGEAVGIIGESGSGKTTVADVILGLLKPVQGKVCMDDCDINTITKAWAKTVGYISQTIYLLDDTIRNNILFGLPEKGSDEKLIWDALNKACLKSFVEDLPDKLDTIVGERGVKLSGGQRQRIAIARAIYNDPDILILDEATAALDNETESSVMESIEHMRGEKTLIIIAHRLSTIEKCDRVIEIRNGKACSVDW